MTLQPAHCPSLPAPFANIGRALPLQVIGPLLGRLLNHVLRKPLAEGAMEILATRELALRVDDLGVQLGFRLLNNRISVSAPVAPDAIISGPFAAFAWLAGNEADADTLFFHRHLLMEGDTELGLVVKNVLDATDLSTLPPLLRRTLGLLIRTIPAQAPGKFAHMPGSPYQ